ncbi:hypothetical protein N665_0048s0009 [Sinapis alba]|nr:hypothetical protein N665_0048s0009 [Sinapis alba]
MDEGDWFEIQNFKLIHASGLIRLSTNKYHIQMISSSVITKIQPKKYCNYYFFANFCCVLRGLSHPMYSIGMDISLGELQAYKDEIFGGISHKINFSLINIG